MSFVNYQEVLDAYQRIQSFIYYTPLEKNALLSASLGCQVFLKFENQQTSGSFKARGAYNKILSLSGDKRKQAFFVAASTGNHAAAFCTALNQLQLKGKVFLPENVAASKLQFIQSLGVPFELFGKNSLQTEIHCRKIADEHKFTLVHPYNDRFIVAGQGTVALEMLQQQPDLDAVFAPVGGGGLIAGIASYLKDIKPEIEIVGCQPSNSPEMVKSIEQGSIIKDDISLPTLSDGTAGGMEPGSITFEICRQRVDRWALLSEQEIAFEIVAMLETNQILIEGAAALPLAYLRKNSGAYQGKNVGIVISGKRISREKLRSLLCDS